MPDLEPDVGVGEGARRIAENAIEALQALLVLALLLIDDPEAEQYFIRLIEVWNEEVSAVALEHPDSAWYIPLSIFRTDAKASSA